MIEPGRSTLKNRRFPFPPVWRLLDPRIYVEALADIGRLVTNNSLVTVEIVKRDLRGQHAGQVLGRAWGIGQPLLMLALYAFVFAVVFEQRVGGTFELPRDYTTYLLAGLVPWLALVQAMSRGATAVHESAELVKQTVFRVEVLPLARAIGACLPLLVGLAFITIYLLARYHTLPATYSLVPVLVVLQLAAMAGVAFALATAGTFVRDVREMVQIFSFAGIFLLPIVYLPASIPDLFKPVLYANPFSYLVWCYQDAIYFGRFEHPWAWPVFGLESLLFLVLGYRLFRRLRPLFGNVL